MNVKEMMQKIEDGEFGKDDINAFLENTVSFGNENEEIQEELEDMGNKSFLFRVEEYPDDFWLKIDDGKLSTGKGAIENPTLIYDLHVDVCVGILAGTEDSTAAYMQGKLKLEGPLSDASAFVSLLELIREEMEDAE